MASNIGECSNSAWMDGEGEDRLSSLPENVMSNILSRIPTKEAVRTSVLSKAWLMMWTCIMSLYFDDETPSPSQVEKKERFRQFVQKVIRDCGASKIENFHLTCSQKYDEANVLEWISHALRRGVQSLQLRYRCGRFVFPSSFFECQSLEEVNLLLPCILIMPLVTRFNNLKTLLITRAVLMNENEFELGELSFDLPVLQEFTMMCCVWKNVKAIKITAPCLSTLHMAWCRFETSTQDRGVERFKVDVLSSTSLKTFKWAGYFIENFELPSPPTVSEALLDHIIEIRDYRNIGNRAGILLGMLGSVVELELSIDIAEAMDRSGRLGSLPMFEQLTTMKVESRFTGSTKALMNLLRKTPNLRVLEINSSLSWKNDDCEMLGTLPLCVMIRLQEVYFTYRFGSSIGLHLMKLLLTNASMLELLHLTAPELSSILKTDLRLQLLLTRRASRNVSIVVL